MIQSRISCSGGPTVVKCFEGARKAASFFRVTQEDVLTGKTVPFMHTEYIEGVKCKLPARVSFNVVPTCYPTYYEHPREDVPTLDDNVSAHMHRAKRSVSEARNRIWGFVDSVQQDKNVPDKEYMALAVEDLIWSELILNLLQSPIDPAVSAADDIALFQERLVDYEGRVDTARESLRTVFDDLQRDDIDLRERARRSLDFYKAHREEAWFLLLRYIAPYVKKPISSPLQVIREAAALEDRLKKVESRLDKIGVSPDTIKVPLDLAPEPQNIPIPIVTQRIPEMSDESALQLAKSVFG